MIQEYKRAAPRSVQPFISLALGPRIKSEDDTEFESPSAAGPRTTPCLNRLPPRPEGDDLEVASPQRVRGRHRMRNYGRKSVRAWPVCISNGSELCSWKMHQR